ncbi:DUF4190 domain-containing protein [Streptomyces sp. NPDC006288]|uniref:DUF4190 domain-containing protein n=1 Tax=Streptomyces sp. NPDC006288 TaxID=3156743 RepID=UPI0033B13527
MTLTTPRAHLSAGARSGEAPAGHAARSGAGSAGASAGGSPSAGAPSAGGSSAPARRPSREADGLAVASFVLGLLGLLVMNILLGPVAIVMALIALARSTTRRGRALLGLGLGIADLVVLAVVVTANGTVSWSLAG